MTTVQMLPDLFTEQDSGRISCVTSPSMLLLWLRLFISSKRQQLPLLSPGRTSAVFTNCEYLGGATSGGLDPLVPCELVTTNRCFSEVFYHFWFFFTGPNLEKVTQ